MRIVLCGVLAGAALLMAGCATKPEIPFDRTANAINRIGLVDPGMPVKANVILAGTVGQSVAASAGLAGALIGGIVDESMRAARVRHFEEGARKANFVAHDRLVAALTNALQMRGYSVTAVQANRADQGKWLASYPHTNEPPVDAYLDVAVLDYGYIAAGIGKQPYRPFVQLMVKLVRASDSAVLMQDTIFYNPLGAPRKVVTVAPDSAYAFDDADALYAAPEHAVEGVDKAFVQTADALSNLLR